jgi:DNA (cytosine-5)-methyltransferase 1
LGFSDIRGKVFFHVYNFIKEGSPKIFILENVKNLIYHDGGRTFKIIMELLEKLGKYNITYDVLNTKDLGIPQSRQRVYIVGILKPLKVTLPSYKLPMLDIETLLEHDRTKETYYPLSERESRTLNDIIKNDNKVQGELGGNWIMNLNVSDYTRGRRYLDYSPCLYTQCKYYLTKYGRHITPYEALKLQGIAYENYNWDMLSRNQIYSVAGNSMSVNVLLCILINLFSGDN